MVDLPIAKLVGGGHDRVRDTATVVHGAKDLTATISAFSHRAYRLT